MAEQLAAGHSVLYGVNSNHLLPHEDNPNYFYNKRSCPKKCLSTQIPGKYSWRIKRWAPGGSMHQGRWYHYKHLPASWQAWADPQSLLRNPDILNTIYIDDDKQAKHANTYTCASIVIRAMIVHGTSLSTVYTSRGNQHPHGKYLAACSTISYEYLMISYSNTYNKVQV